MSAETVVALVFILVIGGGVLIVIAGLRQRTKVLEMAHRERLAMIERGLPPSELPALPARETQMRRAARSSKLLSAGIVIVGFGLGLATLIGFASREPEIAVGVGGAIAIIGGALIVTALVVRGGREEEAGFSESRTIGVRRPPPTDPSL